MSTDTSRIERIGAFSSQPHASSVTSLKPIVSASGESRDALLHIAVAQVLPDQSGLHSAPDGLDRLEAWAAQAASENADVVVFPEYFLSGATHELWQDVRTHSQTQAGDEAREKVWLDRIVATASKHDVDIVAGTVVELGSHHKQDDEGLFNTAYYVTRSGEVHRYTKQNLWHPERTTLSHSQAHTHPDQHHGPATFIIQTKRGTRIRAAMAICWDLAWYDRFNQMLDPPHVDGSDLDRHGQVKGPDVVFAPTCWYASDGGPKALAWNPTAEAKLLDSLTQTRALELEAVVVMANVAGPVFASEQLDELRNRIRADAETELPLVGLGRSTIAAPFLGIAAQLPDASEALLCQSIDLNLLLDARNVYRMRYDHAQRAAH